jgi:hypothetical protein
MDVLAPALPPVVVLLGLTASLVATIRLVGETRRRPLLVIVAVAVLVTFLGLVATLPQPSGGLY